MSSPKDYVNRAIDQAEAVLAEKWANDTQIGGNHYKKGGEEHWDRVARLDLDYWQAAATKYLERCDEKNGIEDMEKAIHYIQKRIELARAGKLPGWRGQRYALDRQQKVGYGAVMGGPGDADLSRARHPYERIGDNGYQAKVID